MKFNWNQIKILFPLFWKAARPQTLIASIAPVFVGVAFAIRADHEISFFIGFLCFLFAISLQIVANYFNDCFDAKKGADTKERLGPQRMVASGLISFQAMRRVAIWLLGFSIFLGLLIILLSKISIYAWGLIPALLFLAFLAFGYSAGPLSLAYKGLGEVCVILVFGLIAVPFTNFALLGAFYPEVWLAGLTLGLLVNLLLIANNLRDINEDRGSKKRTSVVRFGEDFGVYFYRFSLIVVFLFPMVLLFKGDYSIMVLLPLLLISKWANLWDRIRSFERIKNDPFFAQTAQFILLYALLLSLGIIKN